MRRTITMLNLPSPGRLLLILLILALLLSAKAAMGGAAAEALAPALFGRSIVIDAGHGGWDPGMQGQGGSVEQEINLSVALKLAEYLRQAGALVTLTREDGEALAETKAADMASRVFIAKEAGADAFISLHCNSFVSSRSQHGAQVFFQTGNEEGQLLAKALQDSLTAELANTERLALKHPDSYLLKNISCPAAIAEMGFLSNSEEEALLMDSAYQWQVAWALFLGTEAYFAAR